MRKFHDLFRNLLYLPYWIVTLLLCSTTLAGEVFGPAPDFTLKSHSGKNLRLKEYKGQVVLLNFWASWCGPCREEMPLLEDLHKKYERLGFTVLAINVDEDSNKGLSLLKEVPVSFPVVFDPESKITELFNVEAMPTTYLLDRDGNMRYLHRGYQPGYEVAYETQIKTLVRE